MEGLSLYGSRDNLPNVTDGRQKVSTEEGKFVGPSGSFLNCLYFLSKMKNKVIKKVRVKDKVL